MRSGARYERTLRLLENAKTFAPGDGDQVRRDGRAWAKPWTNWWKSSATWSRGVDILTVGQYLRPSRDHLPIARFYTPDEFAYLKDEALRFGFRHVESGPLVRSSYHAHEQAEATRPV